MHLVNIIQNDCLVEKCNLRTEMSQKVCEIFVAKVKHLLCIRHCDENLNH